MCDLSVVIFSEQEQVIETYYPVVPVKLSTEFCMDRERRGLRGAELSKTGPMEL